MTEPDYTRPFSSKDFRGYFTWRKSLSEKLGGNVYHACHEKELRRFIRSNRLRLRSEWSIELPAHGLYSVPGVWCGLNYFVRGNHYGPFLLTFSISVLNNRTFMVFRRKGEDRRRYFFVQYESKIPIYSFNKKLWRIVNPEAYFKESGNDLLMLDRAIYDIIITEPIPINDVKIEGVSHPYCISQKCDGITRRKNESVVKQIALKEFERIFKENQEYRNYINRFECMVGEKTNLPEISSLKVNTNY